MNGKILVFGTILLTGWAAMKVCHTGSKLSPESLSTTAQAGKEIFVAKECNQCHYVGDEEVASEAPDLLDPFLANDSLFVRTHLRFVELSKMPAVELTEQEIQAVSRYVAEMHRAKYPTVSREDADVICPVCYAPVSSKVAKQADLEFIYLKDRFYFECEHCLAAFRKAPEAFSELLKQHEAGQTRFMNPVAEK